MVNKERKKRLVDKTKAAIKVMTGGNWGTRRGKRSYADGWGRIVLQSSSGPTLFTGVNYTRQQGTCKYFASRSQLLRLHLKQ
jgi:hypothetical protein